jgi:hypothetical protein
MARPRSDRRNYEWMLGLSAEGWAWEFLRRNTAYQCDYRAFKDRDDQEAAEAALHWGLLRFVDPVLDAREAIVFWSPAHNKSVLPLVTAGEGQNGLAGLKCKMTVLEGAAALQRHVLYSCCGRFIQLTVTGQGELDHVRYMVDALPERGSDLKLVALRRLADLTEHKRLRPELYGRQRRGPRLSHIVEVLDAYTQQAAHRSVARKLFGDERADSEWENLRDHIRRAISAGRRLMQGGYLEFLR